MSVSHSEAHSTYRQLLTDAHEEMLYDLVSNLSFHGLLAGCPTC
jgi:hypothetical protein